MSLRYLIYFGLFIGICLPASTQDKTVINETVYWFYYSQKVKLNDDWGLSGIFQYRHFSDRDQDYHLFATASVNRKLKGGFSVGAGFTNLNINRPVDEQYVLVPELRPIQSLAYAGTQGKVKFNWRVMVEERFFRKASQGELVSGYTFQWRFRNKMLFMFPLTDQWSLEVSSEVMVNAGDAVSINVFDQHRGILQLHWDLAPFKIMTGYMHWFFQTAGNQHQNRHTFLLGLGHNLDLSKD